MSKKILVTEGAGFIGSHLCKDLLENGHNVICVDNFYTGNIKNLDDIKNNKTLKLLNMTSQILCLFRLMKSTIWLAPHLRCIINITR